jgi:hypothetical protein
MAICAAIDILLMSKLPSFSGLYRDLTGKNRESPFSFGASGCFNAKKSSEKFVGFRI